HRCYRNRKSRNSLGVDMSKPASQSSFTAKLLQPSDTVGEGWSFLLLPRGVSEKLARRGRTSVEGSINGHPFQAMLEPDGQLSHWLKVSKELREASGIKVGDMVAMEIAATDKELEPE